MEKNPIAICNFTQSTQSEWGPSSRWSVPQATSLMKGIFDLAKGRLKTYIVVRGAQLKSVGRQSVQTPASQLLGLVARVDVLNHIVG